MTGKGEPFTAREGDGEFDRVSIIEQDQDHKNNSSVLFVCAYEHETLSWAYGTACSGQPGVLTMYNMEACMPPLHDGGAVCNMCV